MNFIRRLVFRSATAVHSRLYRATGGRLGGSVAGGSVLLLTTTGRRSGKRRMVPLGYFVEGDDLVVVGSMGGAPVHPSWYHNLRAQPDVEVQVGKAARRMRARTATPEERARLWPGIIETAPAYGRYQERTAREIPLVILSDRRAGGEPPADP